MYLASFRTRPSALVLATLSDPAKSTRFSFDLERDRNGEKRKRCEK
jgi:hypothetical protein